MRYFLLLLLLLFWGNGKAQLPLYSNSTIPQCIEKPALEPGDLKNWPQVVLLKISTDGKFCGYVVEDKSQSSSMLNLMGTVNNWKMVSTINGSYYLSSNGHKAVWINSHDSLCIATMGTSMIHYISGVLSFDLNGDCLTYQPKDPNGGLIVGNIKNGWVEEQQSPKETIVINGRKLQVVLQRNKDSNQLALIFPGNRRRARCIWKGGRVENIIKDHAERQLSFTSGKAGKELYYYKIGMDSVICLKIPIDSNCIFAGLSHFSNNSESIFFNLTNSDPLLRPKAAVLNVWSYMDSQLQLQQLNEMQPRQYTGVLRLSDHHFFRLDSGNDWLFLPTLQDTVVLIRQQDIITPVDEINWNMNSEFSWYLVSLKDGRKNELSNINKNWIVQLSPSGKYVIYYDVKKKGYFSYEANSGKERCLTSGIRENWVKNWDRGSYGKYIAGWQKDDAAVFINGERDIWQIDPAGLAPPVNVTNGYGNKHNIIFFLALEEYSQGKISVNESLLLTAFNFDTKENGFYKKVIGAKGDPELLSMGPYIYDVTDNPGIPPGINYSPVKALHANRYVVRRMSAKEAPNFFFTADFKFFKPLSNLQPQLLFNWYKPELHHWKSLDNRMLQGILYKPEDFDSSRKYPVIFYYYERKSDGLNAYLEPRSLDNGCAINIPYYVSNGYMVFCPDIHYNIGDPMQGTYDAVVSAANYVARLPYVDGKRMGVQGCSWGAIQTNYLIAHTNIFAAACSASGIANWISDYGSIAGSGESMQGMFEIGQFRIGATLWQKPEVYIKSSPILNVSAITTPFLLMHTTKDMICDFSNIRGFFAALFQLRKKSWMLLYEGNHGVYGKDGEDFSWRMKQFFDHYLRDFPAPTWMIHPSLP